MPDVDALTSGTTIPRLSRREAGQALLLFVGLTVLFTYPLPLDLAGTTLPLGPDGNLFMWTLGWDTHAFLRHPLSIFDANIYHPQLNTLAYSENLIGSAFFAAPVLWLTGNPVLALNVVALLSCVLSGFGTYVLARRVGVSPTGAAISGIVFAFSPARFFRTGQIHLGVVQWIPLGLAALHAYLDGGRSRDLRLAAGLFSLQALSTGHGAAFMTLAFVLLIVYRVVMGEPIAVLRRVRDLGVTGVLLLLPAVLIYLPYRRVQQEMGLRRTLENWIVTPESFIASPTHLHQWLFSLVSETRILDTASAFLFPGYLPLLLAGVGLVWHQRSAARGAASGWMASIVMWRETRRRDAITFYGLILLVGVLLSIGPPFGIWPLVYDWPALSLVRVPSRFTIVAILGVSVLAGFGFDRVRSLVAANTFRSLIVACAIGLVLVAEFAAMPLTVVPNRVDIPGADRWLARIPGTFAIAEVPLPSLRDSAAFERRTTLFMLHSTAHWQKTVHGYSGIRPAPHSALYTKMRTFPDETSLAALDQFGVTYVVVHTDLYGAGEWERVSQRIQEYGPRLRLRYVDGPGRVYELQ
jgi:hypothetical protein